MVKQIVFGISSGELLEPHHPSLSREFLDLVIARMDVHDPYCFGCASDSYDFIRQIGRKGETLVEMYGIWEDACIASGIVRALSHGMRVRVPKGPTFRSPGAEGGTLENDVENLSRQLISASYDPEFIYFSRK